MTTTDFDDELARRLALLEDPTSDESILPPLPARDVWLAAVAIAVVGVALTWWGYPG